MDSYRALLDGNREWVTKKLELEPDFFERTSKEQSPEFLWIGCSDSRVPAEEITGASPGEIFVHRNIANMVIHTDFSMLSVLQFAIEILKVKHIIVCGHYNCGGIAAAMSRKNYGLINNWLRNINDVYSLHHTELDTLSDPQLRANRLVELNVVEQVRNLAETSFVQHSWMENHRPSLHGWVYELHSGKLNDVVRVEPHEMHSELYRLDFGN